MLNLINIGKVYGKADTKVDALKNINLSFPKAEFVSVLGPSGCGKTTLLNLLGGLDTYTSGELVINEQSTKNYSAKDWDTYRNEKIGFVFQSYNLINHISVLSNVELALTLSGIGATERKKRALFALSEVGLTDKAYKKPNELSGGQMQRVAIARAIVNKPDIILADEPTGALDTKTSKQVLQLLKKISKNCLVIMVTHNKNLAEIYSDRIIMLLDGNLKKDYLNTKANKQATQKSAEKEENKIEVIDNNENIENDEKEENKPKTKNKKPKSSMSFFTAMALSFKNLLTKKLRTTLVAFAGSIGIIGIALVLAVSNGFSLYLSNFQKTTLMSLPITINPIAQIIDFDKLTNSKKPSKDNNGELDVVSKDESGNPVQTNHLNNITEEYLQYLQEMNTTLFKTDTAKYAEVIYNWKNMKIFMTNSQFLFQMSSVSFSKILNNAEYMQKHLQVIEGRLPENPNEIVVITQSDGSLNAEFLTSFGLDLSSGDKLQAKDLLSSNFEISLIGYDDWFIKTNAEPLTYFSNTDRSTWQASYDAGMKLKVVGVVKANPDDEIGVFKKGNTFGYLTDIEQIYYNMIKDSSLSTDFKQVDQINIDGFSFPDIINPSKVEISKAKSTFGASEVPYSIDIYAKDFETKNKIKDYLDNYNTLKTELKDKIVYTDQASMVSMMFGEVINIVSIILVAFSAISLVVSSIMIGIIIYISVIERTKEIGVLRSIGARKKDVARVFLAESLIIGIFSGLLGVGLTALLTIPINLIVASLIDSISTVAVMSVSHVIYMIVLSGALTLVAGSIPALIASKKNPVTALRSEV